MAPSTVNGHLLARALSHGGIAGAVVGAVVGATLIFLLILPFILRCIREHRYRKQIAQENAELGITGHCGGPGEPYRPPYFAPAAGQGSSGPPTHSGDATATPGDNNSSDDGKALASASASAPSPSLPASAAPTKDLEAALPASSAAAPPGPAGTDAPAVPPPAAAVSTSGADPVPGPSTTRGVPASSQQNEPRSQTPLRKLYPAHTFPILPSQDYIPRVDPGQRSSTMRSSRHSSLSQSLEGFFGGRMLRHGSNRSAPTRVPTMRSTRGPSQQSRSPVEIDFDNLDPINHHTWLMRQQGIEDFSTGVDPSFFEIDYQHLTGASAEYYSGTPLSPPTDPSSTYMAPISYAPTPPSALASTLINIAGAAGIAGAAAGPKRQPKPLASRTDSMCTTATGTDFSPLPLSPTSPLPKVHEGCEEGSGERGIVDGPASAERGLSPAGLTSESGETMQRSPSYGGLVPSPQPPAPGTVNPMDVWAPATEDERFTYKAAELDRIEQSPQTVRSSQSGSVSATDMASRESSSSPFPSEFLNDDVVDDAMAAAITAHPTPTSQSPPDVKTATASSAPSPAEVVEVASPETQIKIEYMSEPTTPAAPLEVSQEPTSTSQGVADTKSEHIDAKATTTTLPDSIDLEELMTDDFQGGINFAFGDSVSYNHTQDTQQSYENGNNAAASYQTEVNAQAAQPVPTPQTFAQQPETMYWSAPADMNGQVPHDMSGAMLSTMPDTTSMPPAMMPNMTQNTMPNMSNMPPSMPPMHQMIHQMPTTMPPHGHVPSISEPYLVPDNNQMDYNNGMLLTSTFTVPNNGYPGMNNMGGMHPVNYNNGMAASHYSMHTPQSSPGHYAGQQHMNGNVPHYHQQQHMSLPLTPSPKGMPNFNSPLAVPGYEGANGPVSPLSNQGSTSSHATSLSPRVHACEECGRVFDQVHKLNHHKRYHERPHECAVAGCGKRFGTKTHLDRHVNDKHSKSRKYHCTEDSCPYSLPGGKSFPRKDNWRRHMVNKHGLQPEHDPIEVIDQPMVSV